MTSFAPVIDTEVDRSPDIDVLFAEALQVARARRRRRAIVAALAVTALAAAGIAWHAVGSTDAGSTGQPAIPKLSSTAFPSTFVGYDVDEKTNAGGIRLFDSQTGKTLRTIVPIRGDYPGTQFANLSNGLTLSDDGQHVFFIEATTSSARAIVEASVSGTESHVIVDGIEPAVSLDGESLAYRPTGRDVGSLLPSSIGIAETSTGRHRTVTIPGEKDGQQFSYAWLPGSHDLLVSLSNVDAPPIVSRPDYRVHPDPALTARAYLLDADTMACTPLPERTVAALQQTNSRDVTLLGPSRTPNVVDVEIGHGLPGSGASTSLGTLDVKTGRLTTTADLPPHTGLAAYAALPQASSGLHHLVQYDGSSRRDWLQPYAWTPSSGTAPTPIAARLDTTGVMPRS